MVTMATHIAILPDGGGGGTFKINHILADTYHILPN